MMDNEYSPVAHVLALWYDDSPLAAVEFLYRNAARMREEGDPLQQVDTYIAAARMIEDTQHPVQKALGLMDSIEASRRALAEAEAVPENRKAVA